MSGEIPLLPSIPIQEWVYPDRIDKSIMNDLIQRESISSLDYLRPEIDTDVADIVIHILDSFEQWGYVTSEMVDENAGGGTEQGFTYKKYSITPFFRAAMAEYRAQQAEDKRLKLELWDAQQAELPPEERFNPPDSAF